VAEVTEATIAVASVIVIIVTTEEKSAAAVEPQAEVIATIVVPAVSTEVVFTTAAAVDLLQILLAEVLHGSLLLKRERHVVGVRCAKKIFHILVPFYANNRITIGMVFCEKRAFLFTYYTDEAKLLKYEIHKKVTLVSQI
jgi:hypothetical protein